MTTALLPRVEVERGLDEHDLLRARRDRVRFVHVPYRRYLMVDGHEAPGGDAFKQAISTLYPIAYTLHFKLRARGINAPVGALEGIYWQGAPGPIAPEAFAAGLPGDALNWLLMIAIPDAANDEEIASAIQAARAKADPTPLRPVRWEGWLEGDCAQILHIGNYDAEYPTIARLHEAIRDADYQPCGSHHEIYVSGPSSSPERMKTIIRQPIEEAGW